LAVDLFVLNPVRLNQSRVESDNQFRNIKAIIISYEETEHQV